MLYIRNTSSPSTTEFFTDLVEAGHHLRGRGKSNKRNMQKTTFLCIIVALIAFAEADVGINRGDEPDVHQGAAHNPRNRRRIEKIIQVFEETNKNPYPDNCFDRNGYLIGDPRLCRNSELSANTNGGRVQPGAPNNYGSTYPLYPPNNRGQPEIPIPFVPDNRGGYPLGPFYPNSGYRQNFGVGYPPDNRYGSTPFYPNYGYGPGAPPPGMATPYSPVNNGPFIPRPLYPNNGNGWGAAPQYLPANGARFR